MLACSHNAYWYIELWYCLELNNKYGKSDCSGHQHARLRQSATCVFQSLRSIDANWAQIRTKFSGTNEGPSEYGKAMIAHQNIMLHYEQLIAQSRQVTHSCKAYLPPSFMKRNHASSELAKMRETKITTLQGEPTQYTQKQLLWFANHCHQGVGGMA